jgi:hypothetical protein
MTDFSRVSWYARRLGRMSPAEIAWRMREQAMRRAWARRQVLPGQLPTGPVPGLAPGAGSAVERRFTAVLPSNVSALVPETAKDALIADADKILKGEWEMLGVLRTDLDAPDWSYDPVTGRRSDLGQYAFSVNQRDEEQVGNIKQVWEVNRLQHLTLLAAAWYLTGTDDYARRVDSQLRSWWRENPFLSGVNWTSGIELGIRLINFAWIRRLLDSWPGTRDLFEGNDLAVRQLRWHQEYLAAFESRGSSANNHLIAEVAGLLAGSCAFPWFKESSQWRSHASAVLARSLRSNTFPSGINRELATDYHGFVFELGVFGALEAAIAGYPVGADTRRLLCSMADCMAALVDERCQPPRQGDSDEGRVVLLDAPERGSWPALLALGDTLFGRLDWWPEVAPDVGSVLMTALAPTRQEVTGRPAERPSRFADAGVTILRTSPGDSAPEIWCRCDGGPHGFLSIAAHAHADALSVEVRHGGVDILADPGTYCYHGEPEWRAYFQSTIAHNTVEVDGQWQSQRGGAFLWLRHAQGRELAVTDDGTVASWTADHDGYTGLRPSALHHRSVRLDRAARSIDITDVIKGGSYDVRLPFHLGPDVQAELEGCVAVLSWTTTTTAAGEGAARLLLPGALTWSLHSGETEPVLGWYSAGLGQRVPIRTLLGTGRCAPGSSLLTRLEFGKDQIFSGLSESRKAASSGASNVTLKSAPWS